MRGWFGTRLFCRVRIGLIEVFIDGCMLGLELTFSSENGRGRYSAGAMEGVSTSMERLVCAL